MKTTHCFIFVHLLSIMSIQVAASTQVVYDSLSTSATSSIGIREIGNTITLAGSKRFVTSFTVNAGISTSKAGQTNDYVLRFYNPSAPNDYPGKLFWQSPPLHIVMAGGTQAITFDVPLVRVPDTFIYSVMDAGDAYFPMCYGPTVGSSPEYCWTNLKQETFSSSNHLQVRIEAQDRPDARLIGWIQHDAWGGSGAEDYYSMEFEIKMGGYWDMFGPSVHAVTEWDEGSFYNLDAADYPDAVEYLTNGVDEYIRVSSEHTLYGNVESDTIIKPAGIAGDYPDLYGCIITDFVLKVDEIIIDHSEPSWTYFTSDVTWEIWGFEKSPDQNLDGKVDLIDFSIFASAWNTQPGQPQWNPACDIALPDNSTVSIEDLLLFSTHWLDGCIEQTFEEGFETSDFSLYEWLHTGDADWAVVSDVVYEGTYAAKSGDISDSQQSILQIEINISGDVISFYRKVSSENNYDFLRFYIDDIQQGQWSGLLDWAQVSFPVTPGLHTFKWAYEKDFIVSSNDDCAWIDQIKVE